MTTAFFNQPGGLPDGKIRLFERPRVEVLKDETESDN